MANFPLAGQTDVLSKAATRFGTDFDERVARAKAAGIDVSKIDPTVGFLLASVDPDKQFEITKRLLDEQEQRQMRQAEKAQQLGKESLSETAKYQMLFNVPQGISQAFGNQAMLNLLGARSATEALSTTLANYPRAQFASYQFQPQSYLS